MEFPPLYAPATRLSIKSHPPPEPFGKTGYKHVKTPGVADVSPKAVGHLNFRDLIYAVHPRDRHEPSIVPLPDWFIDNQGGTIKIVCSLSTNIQGAQAVLCEVLQAPDVLWKKMGHKRNDLPRKVVAKIFDPLHYRGHVDPVAEADREYAQEAAAYIQLHGKRDTKVYTDKPDLVPKFYGTWTTDITSNHFRKTGMSSKRRMNTLKTEARRRKWFAAVAAKNDTSSKQSKLSPHSFRPVRIILTQYIDGTPLWQHLIKAIDDTQSPIIKPREKFKQEEVRLSIFGSMLDTIARIEHLGVKLLTVPTRAPAVFLITEKREVASVHEEANVKYGVVMTDFTQADVSCYTDIGYNLVEKLPLPPHPSRSYDLVKSLMGWYPREWTDEVDKYEKWGESYFKSSDYADSETILQVANEVRWIDHLGKFGRAPPSQDDPKWQKKLKAMWAVQESWKKFAVPTAEEYRQQREAGREKRRIRQEKKKQGNRNLMVFVFHKSKSDRALDGYMKKFGRRPSGSNDPTWRQLVDEIYANAPASCISQKSYKVPKKSAPKENIKISRTKEEGADFEESKLRFHEIKRQTARREYKNDFGHRPSGRNDPEWRRIVDKVYASASAADLCDFGKSYETSETKASRRSRLSKMERSSVCAD